MPQEIRMRAQIVEEMLRLARSEPRVECCGLLAGVNGMITKIFPAKNALASPTAYEVAPQELFPLFRQMREEGLEHLGIYHSHPDHPSRPSQTDTDRAWADYSYVIISVQQGTVASAQSWVLNESEKKFYEEPLLSEGDSK